MEICSAEQTAITVVSYLQLETLSHTWPSLKHVHLESTRTSSENQTTCRSRSLKSLPLHMDSYSQDHKQDLWDNWRQFLMMLESSKSIQKSTSCNLENGCSLLKKSTHILAGSNLAVTVNVTSECFSTSHVEISFIQYLSFQTTSFCAIPYLECQIPPKIPANQVSSTSSTPAMPWSSISTSNSQA